MPDLPVLNQPPEPKRDTILYLPMITSQLTKSINELIRVDSEILYLRALVGMGPLVSKFSGQIRAVICDLSQIVQDIEFREPGMDVFGRMSQLELDRYRYYDHEERNAAQALIGWQDLRRKLVEGVRARGQGIEGQE